MNIRDELLQSVVEVNTVTDSRSMAVKALLEETKAAGKGAIVLTFTPGPFLPTEELPAGWTENRRLVGCTAQLNTFRDRFNDLNANVFSVNKHPKQTGPEGLIKKKNLEPLAMIANGDQLSKKLGLNMISLGDTSYPDRITMVFRTNDSHDFKIFPIGEIGTIKEHIDDIAEFIKNGPKQEQSATVDNDQPSVMKRKYN